jgi:hypothetical protein
MKFTGLRVKTKLMVAFVDGVVTTAVAAFKTADMCHAAFA